MTYRVNHFVLEFEALLKKYNITIEKLVVGLGEESEYTYVFDSPPDENKDDIYLDVGYFVKDKKEENKLEQ